MNSKPSRIGHLRCAIPDWRLSATRAFSLLELVAVLAVIAILAAFSVPSIIKRIDYAAKRKESAALSAISDGFVQHILRSNNIPSDLLWAQTTAAELTMATANITNTPRNYARVLLIDNSGWLTNVLTFGVGWNQPIGGTTSSPSGARLLLVSSLGGSLPSSLTAIGGSRPTPAVFNDIWGTSQGTKPTNAIWASYKGTGDDLLIQRINLEPLFHKVLLVNNDIGSGAPNFSVNALGVVAAANPVPAGTGWSSYYLDGTVLGLRSNTTLQVQEVLRKDISRVFENGFWRDEIGTGAHISTDFATIAAQFFQAPAPPGMKWGQTTKGVYDGFNTYMFSYATWANTSPPFYGATGSPGNDKKFAPYILLDDFMQGFTSWTGSKGYSLLLGPP